MAWRMAKSLQVLLAEYDRANPGRDKTSDGSLGDAVHRAGWQSSDHNPWRKDSRGVGVVRARDFDAGRGLFPDERNDGPGDALLDSLLRRGKAGDHPALGVGAYLIYEGHIYRHGTRFRQESYWGPNRHHSHVHVSVGLEQSAYDSTRAWGVASPSVPLLTRPSSVPLVSRLTFGATNADVKLLQQRLVKLGFNVGEVDGEFGPMTRAAVVAFQRKQGLGVDGIVGPATLGRLF